MTRMGIAFMSELTIWFIAGLVTWAYFLIG
ncbi:hypothetical protein CPL00221_CDS0078 [Escherichia phage RobRod40]